MSRTISSLCIAGATSLALLTPVAAHAAPEGAQGEANAITATILGQSGDSGTVHATNDGTGEQKNSDAVNPLPTVLPDQGLVGIAVLAQDAVATDDGNSAACAGVAGAGGTANLIEIGDTDCLEPGENIDLRLANLDLSALLEGEVVEGSGSLGTAIGLIPGLGDGLATVVGALQDGVDDLEVALGDAGLVLNAGAIESSCTYDGQAEGTTFLTSAGLGLAIPGTGTVDVVNFDTEPEPNTRVITELDDVTALLLVDLEDRFNAQLMDITGPLGAAIEGEVQEGIVEAAVAQLQPALQAIEADLLRVVLNEQTHDGRAITVTGLSAELLPGAAQFGAPTVLDLDIANVGCGPFRGTSAPGTPGRPGTTDGAGNPVPTVVNAGEDSTPWAQSGLLGFLALMVAGGTVVGLRRARS